MTKTDSSDDRDDKKTPGESEGAATPPEPETGRESEPQANEQGFETGAAIPPHYGEDRLGVSVRDSGWLYCYWELEGGGCQRIIDARGKAYLDAARWVLHVSPSGGASYDIDVDPGTRCWYLEVKPASHYQVEFGVIGPDGEYTRIASAHDVRTPPAGVSDRTDSTWGEMKGELDRLLEFVAGGSSWMSLGSRGYLRTLSGQPHLRVEPSSARETDGPGTPNGHLMMVLHAHLPYVRHPEYERFLEEDWLFEAITETYIPLADMLTRLADDDVPVRLAMTLSPTLCEMMADPLLQQRYSAHLDRLVDCADAALKKMRGTTYQGAAEMYCERLRYVRTVYFSWDRNLIHAFRALEDRGVLDILTCGATHGILPLMKQREAMRAQIETGCRNYEKHFGRRPLGIWLPECAYQPEVDEILAECGIRYFFLDSHGILNATPQPKSLTYRPVLTPSGTVAFPRDPETGVLVWSAEHGFPGDPVYREFYRDYGYDGEYETVRPCLHADGVRRNIGLKNHRVTGRVALDKKEPYVPEWAARCAAAHADYFVSANESRAKSLRDTIGGRPVICAMYDAELFGHWWYEGIEFLESVFRRAAQAGSGIEPVTPEEYVTGETKMQVLEPSASSWGDKGYFEHWLNGSNDWVYPHLHKAEERMIELASRYPDADELEARALNQAARELLLAQSSDWAFLMATGTATPYAVRRTRDHVAQFTRLYEMLTSGSIDEEDLSQLENRDAIFQEIDYKLYKS